MFTLSVDIWFVNLGLKFSDWVKSFKIGNFEIFIYGCIIAASVLLALTAACIMARKTGQNDEDYAELMIWGVLFGIIGARLYYVAFDWDAYKDNLKEIFNLRAGGLAIYGGVIAGAVTGWIFCKVKKLNFPLILDTAFLGVVLAQSTGRWSNFVNMECFGGYTDNLFAMRLNIAKVNSSMITQELLEKAVSVDGVTYIQVHPTFLYESLWNLALFIVLLLVTRKKRFHGQIFLLYLMGYGAGRFWIEGLRTDVDVRNIGLTGWQQTMQIMNSYEEGRPVYVSYYFYQRYADYFPGRLRCEGYCWRLLQRPADGAADDTEPLCRHLRDSIRFNITPHEYVPKVSRRFLDMRQKYWPADVVTTAR